MLVRLLATVEFVLLAITSMVAVLEPFSTIAVYVSLTKDLDLKEKRRVISKSMIISFLVLAFFALTGHLVFFVFNVTVAAFKIAGGILLVDVALGMFHPKKGEYSPEGRGDIAVIPLAFPLTSGPGAITTVILLVSEANGLFEASFVFVGIFVGILLTYAGMRYSTRMFKLLGDEGLRTITALMSIIVLAIAVQFMISGITDALSQILVK
jgi:multiple antibiotic resistance protein